MHFTETFKQPSKYISTAASDQGPQPCLSPTERPWHDGPGGTMQFLKKRWAWGKFFGFL